MEKYTLLEFLKEGVFGKVYLYKRKSDQVKVVIKTVDPTALEQEDRADAHREVEILQKLKHVHIVKYEEWFPDGAKICIVMEYCEGGDLHDRIMKGDKLSESQIWEWFIQIGKALEYIHSCKVIHRDLHAKNIFLQVNNLLKLGDFGLAKPYTGSVYLTRSKQAVGALGFNAPEMLDDAPFSDKCDIWALGCVLYFMIMRQIPFDATSVLRVTKLIEKASYPAIPEIFSEELRDTVRWLLTPNPRDRPNIRQVFSSDSMKLKAAPSKRMKVVHGYSWTGDKIVDSAGECYKFDQHSDAKDNETQYESLAEMVTEQLFEVMLRLGLKKLPVPLGPREDPDYNNPGTIIFASEDWKTCECLLVLIHGSGSVKAGQWARQKMIYSTSVESGTQLPYIRKAGECGYGVIVMNCNDRKPKIPGCTSPEDHGLYVWQNYVMDAAASKIAIKSHSDGGSITAAIYKKFERHFKQTVYANAFTGDLSISVPMNSYTRNVTRSWIKSKKPLDTDLTGNGKLKCVSAGVDDHSHTPHYAFSSVFEFFAERFKDKSPGNL